ncbi:hypothetical protein HOY82DRAFT_549737 [Tuber indicum]|nr:hypothetical protein HOY82DRAFT_549737 [Tuber indicum]
MSHWEGLVSIEFCYDIMIGNFLHPLRYLCYWCFNGSVGWTGCHHILRGVGSRTIIPNQPKLTTRCGFFSPGE